MGELDKPAHYQMTFLEVQGGAQASELWLVGLAGTSELAQGALEMAPPCSVLPGRLPGLGGVVVAS